MTNTNALPANNTGWPRFTFGTVEDRIAAHCAWFDLAPPSLEYEDGEVLLTDDMVDWVTAAGGSLDWLLIGDPKGMAVMFRERAAQEKTVLKATEALDPLEIKMLATALKATASGAVAVDDALAVFKAELDAYRAKVTA